MAPVDFDDSDIADVVEELEQPASQQLTDVEVDEHMTEVEKRLEMAQYYRLILSQSMFDGASNPEVADRVETEIRDFVRTRMAALVGVGAVTTSKNSLSDDETA